MKACLFRFQMPFFKADKHSPLETAAQYSLPTVNFPLVTRMTFYRRSNLDKKILYETDCISHSTNTLGKGMNPIILPPCIFCLFPLPA